MPQTALSFNTVNPGGALGPNKADSAGMLMISAGGLKSALNLTAATVIKATPGRLAKLIITAPGSTGGAFTLNDCATTGAAAASNEFFTLLYSGAANVAGGIFTLDWPCLVGIVLSAVPTGGSPICSISFS